MSQKERIIDRMIYVYYGWDKSGILAYTIADGVVYRGDLGKELYRISKSGDTYRLHEYGTITSRDPDLYIEYNYIRKGYFGDVLYTISGNHVYPGVGSAAAPEYYFEGSM